MSIFHFIFYRYSWNKLNSVFLNQIYQTYMNQETRQFILENANVNVHQLALRSGRFPLVDMQLAIRQIAGRQKIKSKIPLFYSADDILYPAQLSIEQSSSESTANYKSTLCEGNTLVDLTGGFGVDCCFMSRQFKEVVYVERQEELCELAQHNFNVLNKNHIHVIHAETEQYLTQMQHMDWIFIDPARRSKTGNKVVFLSDCEPNVSALSSFLLEKAKNVMIKLSPMMDITAAVRDLPNTSEIHIISVENECKEILLILKPAFSDKPIVKTINIIKNNKMQTFDFDQDKELNASVLFCSAIEKYLYEPNAAIMKSGAFKLIGERYELHKLHKNTHLYTSNELKADFPGRIFEVIKEWGTSKNELKNEIERVSKANISTRNYPLSADDLRKKLNIKDGGDVYLFACTILNERKVILECQRLKTKEQR